MKRLFAACGLAAMCLAAVLFFVGCAQMSARKPAMTGVPTPAAKRVAELAQLNQSLRSFKGIGRLKVKRHGQIQIHERVALVGEAPDKLSAVVFISGFPAIRFSTDGSWFYVIESGENGPGFLKRRASESALAQIIGIEISFQEIVTLLHGRVPLSDYWSARLTPGSGTKGDEIALLKWWGVNQTIRLETGSRNPLQTARYDRSGAQRYRAVFMETGSIDSYRVPLHLSILADEETEFTLVMERYEPNIEVSPGMFVLHPVK